MNTRSAVRCSSTSRASISASIPGIEEYVQFFLSEAMSGAGGTLEAAGLIPQPAEKTAEVIAAFEAGAQ